MAPPPSGMSLWGNDGLSTTWNVVILIFRHIEPFTTFLKGKILLKQILKHFPLEATVTKLETT